MYNIGVTLVRFSSLRLADVHVDFSRIADSKENIDNITFVKKVTIVMLKPSNINTPYCAF